MDRGKAKMVEEEKEREEEEEALMDVDGDESKQGNEEIGVQNSNQSALDTMNSLQSSSPTREVILRRVPPSTDESSSNGNTENTASSATLAQYTASLPPPATSSSTEEMASPQQNQESVNEEFAGQGNDHYLKLVESYVCVFNGNDSPPPKYVELLDRVRRYLNGNGNKISEELIVECVNASIAVLKGPLGNFTINLQAPIRMLNVEKAQMVFMVKRLSTKDTDQRLKLPIYFAKKIAYLLTPGDNTEEQGVQVRVLDHELRSREVQLWGFDGNPMFLHKGWTEFRRNKNWLGINMMVKIGAFKDFQSQELSFIIVPGA